MIITPTPAKMFLPRSSVARSEGIHVSGLIRSIAAIMGILKPEWVDDPDYIGDIREITDPAAVLRICIGLAWEEWYISNILTRDGVADHPGEMCVDGVHMTPDGISTSPLTIHEVKASYKSINTTADFSKQWMWLTQLKCYCKGARTLYGRFHVLHICGNYKFPLSPELKCWDIEFTKKEIDTNWELMREYRDYKEGK
jgi:hypothetical protein